MPPIGGTKPPLRWQRRADVCQPIDCGIRCRIAVLPGGTGRQLHDAVSGAGGDNPARPRCLNPRKRNGSCGIRTCVGVTPAALGTAALSGGGRRAAASMAPTGMAPAIAGAVPERPGVLRTLLVFADGGWMRESAGPGGPVGPPGDLPSGICGDLANFKASAR